MFDKKIIEGIEIYTFSISKELQNLERFKSIISKDELEKANKYRFDKDKIEFIICRGNLRIILSKYITISPKDIVFNYNKFGKPSIYHKQNIDGYKFNLSHSGDFCIIGISSFYEIGIDIEKKRIFEDIDNIALNNFTKNEYKQIEGNPQDKVNIFFSIWCQKEALIKSQGEGLNFGLDYWETKITENAYNISIGDQTFLVKTISVDENYSAALSLLMN